MIASFGDSSVKYVASRFARILDSIEVYGVDRRTYIERENGSALTASVTYLPDVWRFNPEVTGDKPDFIAMTERVQHWIFRCNVERVLNYRLSDLAYKAFWRDQLYRYKRDRANGSAYITWWNQLFKGDRSHTNFAGVNTRTNYIAEENMSIADLPKLSNVVTGRFVGKVVDQSQDEVGFECVNMSGDFEQYHPFTHPHLFDQPIVTGRDLLTDKSGTRIIGYWWRVFHHFNKRVVIPLCLPLDGVARYPKALTVAGGESLNK